ncbi:histone H1 [Histoplasma capsulatum]|uniref:Histone H1 n=1 Tax=Ajellomyces capsulatus TaxID=5037 RepID=A0A8A1M0X1_AJECA|nr:histone H1 [Histoplasma capsulatum]
MLHPPSTGGSSKRQEPTQIAQDQLPAAARRISAARGGRGGANQGQARRQRTEGDLCGAGRWYKRRPAPLSRPRFPSPKLPVCFPTSCTPTTTTSTATCFHRLADLVSRLIDADQQIFYFIDLNRYSQSIAMPAKKASASKAASSHASYRDMIKDAIINLKERNGSR